MSLFTISPAASSDTDIPGSEEKSLAAPLCRVQDLSHRYGDLQALRDVNLDVAGGEIVAVLGKNGSGKSTLFRLLSTLMPIQSGRVEIGGVDASGDPLGVRSKIGIIFQSPSLDVQLTVLENLFCQGALYGLSGQELDQRCDEVLEQFGLADRGQERCKTLSGGLKRRVELAKGLLHRPQVMLLDEPSTGLDPAARLQLWQALEDLAASGVAVLLTTHLMEEADKASRLVLMHDGRKVAEGRPASLRGELGGGVLTVVTENLDTAADYLRREVGLEPQIVGRTVRARCDDPSVVSRVAEALGESLESITLGRPSLEDVFVAQTGDVFDVTSG